MSVPVYALVVAIAISVVSPMVSILAAVQIAERRSQQQATDLRSRSCDLYAKILGAYDEDPPATATGRGVREAYERQYQERGCTPVRRQP